MTDNLHNLVARSHEKVLKESWNLVETLRRGGREVPEEIGLWSRPTR
jgi:hypothetical protein